MMVWKFLKILTLCIVEIFPFIHTEVAIVKWVFFNLVVLIKINTQFTSPLCFRCRIVAPSQVAGGTSSAVPVRHCCLAFVGTYKQTPTKSYSHGFSTLRHFPTGRLLKSCRSRGPLPPIKYKIPPPVACTLTACASPRLHQTPTAFGL